MVNSTSNCRPWFDSVLAFALSGAALVQAADATPPRQIAPPNDIVFQFPAPRQAIAQVTVLLHVAQARSQFNVDGTGLTVGVIYD